MQEESAPVSTALLERICSTYTKEVTQFHQSNSRNNHKGVRNMARFGFTGLARTIFDPIERPKLPGTFMSLLDACETYKAQRNISKVGCFSQPISVLSPEELILNMIVPYQLPQCQSKRKIDPAKNAEIEKFNSRRVQFSLEEAAELMRRFLPIPLQPDQKLWKQIRYILVPDNSSRKLQHLAKIVAEATECGKISFAALSFCLGCEHLNQHLTPSCILQCLYLGPLKAHLVEFFASGRSSEFRAECRKAILIAETAKDDPMSHKINCPPNIDQSQPLFNYREFVFNTTMLLNDLRGLGGSHNIIPNGWACAALKKFAKRTYVDKTWKEENLFDLIWTILAQRPNMKKFICETLEREFHDYGAARFWRKTNLCGVNSTYIVNNNITMIDPLADSEYYLNFPTYVKSVQFVSHPQELKHVILMIKSEVADKDSTIVGLDAEWSAFNGDSKASILQVAIREYVYIVDMDSPKFSVQDFQSFFDELFLDKKITKLGFQFSEDLLQMRKAMRHCKALYKPENVLCVGQMIANLFELTEKHPDKANILADILPPLQKIDDSLDSSLVEGEKQDDLPAGETENPDQKETLSTESEQEKSEASCHNIINKGLSYLCQRVLGAPLDKTEQCSVWDRRPLRPLQVRYAAMDAYCCVMLYDVAVTWTERLGITMEELTKKQSPIRVSLPLFIDME